MTVTVANDLSKHSDQTCDIVGPGSEQSYLSKSQIASIFIKRTLLPLIVSGSYIWVEKQ